MMHCSFCQETFNCIDKWVIHIDNEIEAIRTSNVYGPYRCPSCYNEFQSLAILGNHLKNRKCYSYDRNDYTCLICKSSFATEANLFRHTHFGICLKKQNIEQPFRCSNCFTKFTLLSNLRKHQRMNVCNTKLSLVELKVQEDIERFECKRSAKAIEPLMNREVPITARVTERSKGASVKIIGEIKRLSSETATPIAARAIEKPKRTSDKDVSETKSLSSESAVEFPFIHLYNPNTRACPRCSKIMQSKDSWIYHVANIVCVSKRDITTKMMNSFNTRDFLRLYNPSIRSCPICSKVMSNRNSWVYHVMNAVCVGKNSLELQLKAKPNTQCQFCCKFFASPAGLRKHQISTCRFRVKIFKCDWCDKMFNRRIDLVKHLKAIDCITDPMARFGTYFTLETNVDMLQGFSNEIFTTATTTATASSMTSSINNNASVAASDADDISHFIIDASFIDSLYYSSIDDLDKILIDWRMGVDCGIPQMF